MSVAMCRTRVIRHEMTVADAISGEGQSTEKQSSSAEALIANKGQWLQSARPFRYTPSSIMHGNILSPVGRGSGS